MTVARVARPLGGEILEIDASLVPSELLNVHRGISLGHLLASPNGAKAKRAFSVLSGRDTDATVGQARLGRDGTMSIAGFPEVPIPSWARTRVECSRHNQTLARLTLMERGRRRHGYRVSGEIVRDGPS
jgi:hypothetical protein